MSYKSPCNLKYTTFTCASPSVALLARLPGSPVYSIHNINKEVCCSTPLFSSSPVVITFHCKGIYKACQPTSFLRLCLPRRSNDLGQRRSVYIMVCGQPQNIGHNATRATKTFTCIVCHLPHKWPLCTQPQRHVHHLTEPCILCNPATSETTYTPILHPSSWPWFVLGNGH